MSIQVSTSPSSPQSPGSALTPKRDYPLSRSPGSNKIRALFTPGVSKYQGPSVYRFKQRTKTGKEFRYVGKTVRSFKTRIREHCSVAKHHPKQSSLAAAIHDGPEGFVVGVIAVFPKKDDRSLSQAERRCIQKKNTIAQGFNSRNGGGGGVSQPKEKGSGSVEKVVEILRKGFEPPKEYPFTYRKGRLSHTLPRTLSSKRSQLYAIIRTIASKKIYYIGYTSTELRKRISSHLSHSRSLRKAPNNRVYKDLAQHPKQMSFAVLDTSLFPGVPVSVLEKAFIQYYRETAEVYNKTQGGNGGWRVCE